MNNKMYRIGFFVLLVINIALIVMVVMRPRPPIGQVGIKEEISRELNFTETPPLPRTAVHTPHPAPRPPP
ncbi:MAG: hypothetical protein RLN96_11505, partial [Pseudomonadales bacterium]